LSTVRRRHPANEKGDRCILERAVVGKKNLPKWMVEWTYHSIVIVYLLPNYLARPIRRDGQWKEKWAVRRRSMNCVAQRLLGVTRFCPLITRISTTGI
jgi:hypothetical protein